MSEATQTIGNAISERGSAQFHLTKESVFKEYQRPTPSFRIGNRRGETTC